MKTYPAWLLHCFVGAASLGFSGLVHADVTIQRNTTLDVASMIRMHGASTTSIAADKKREDTESHCEGMMSLVCGNVHGGEIIRLDRDVTWHLDPDKKRYREQVFATPVEQSAMRAKMQANLEKMRSCPVPRQQQPPIDKSKCEMSPPKIDVHKTGDKASIAGHDAERTIATLTESCTNKDTGDVCDTVVAIDVWLTQDQLPGSGDAQAFDAAYAKKLGLDEARGIMRGEAAKFLAPYQSQIKQLQDKSSDLKGQPLKTSVRVLMGGPQCSTVKVKSSDSAGGGTASGSTSSGSSPSVNPLPGVPQAGKAVANLVGGLFHKKQAAPADASTAAATPSAGSTPDPLAQYVQMTAFTIETVSINTEAIPGDRFDLPPNWTKEAPKPDKGGSDEYTCPKTGS